MITSKDIRATLGQAVPIRITALDYKFAPMAPISAFFSLTADHKVPPLFTLSSRDTLDCGTIGAGHMTTKFGGRAVQNNVGVPITVALVGDSVSVVTVTVTDNAHVIHFFPSVSTVAQVESAVSTFAAGSLVVSTPSASGSAVLVSGDAFTAQLVTAVVLLEQTTYPGQYVATITSARMRLLSATGDDDPYFWDTWIVDADAQPQTVISDSRFCVFTNITPIAQVS